MGTQGCLFATWCEEVIVTAVHSDNVALKKNFPLSWKPIPTTKRLNKTNNTTFWIIFKIGSSFLAYILPPILGSGNKSPGHTLSKLQIFGTAIILILLEVFNKLESLGTWRSTPSYFTSKLCCWLSSCHIWKDFRSNKNSRQNFFLSSGCSVQKRSIPLFPDGWRTQMFFLGGFPPQKKWQHLVPRFSSPCLMPIDIILNLISVSNPPKNATTSSCQPRKKHLTSQRHTKWAPKMS